MIFTDITPWALGVLSAIVAPSTGYVIRQGMLLSSRFKVHEAVDLLQFANINEHLKDLKNEQTNQTEKLDRLIERFL